MGNSESQYSIQGPKGTSLIFPGKQKPYSLKLGSAKGDALSPHSWWKNAPVGSGYKARCVGRGCLSPPKSRQPYSARLCDYVSKGVRGSPAQHRWHRSPGCGIRKRHMSDDDNPYGVELNGHALNGDDDEHGDLGEQSSPRVVIKKDGTLRVEFTNTSGNPLHLDEATGPVQLLKFSPNVESASTPSLPGSSGAPLPASTSSTARTSKGSSLSSDGSWYDSPWGLSAELCEQDQPCSASRTLAHSPIHQIVSFAEQSPPLSITDLYKDPTMAATFPTARDLSSQLHEPPPGQRPHRASFASILDVPLEEECPEPRQYSSYTLPCRRPKSHTVSENLHQYGDQGQRQEQVGLDFIFQKKDSIKNRIRRFSDWTGSLSRKKRKSQSQEPRYKDLSDTFDSGVDGLTADTSSPSQVSSLLWFPGASRAQSSGAIHQTTNDALRQNIYENFMRELETGTGQGGGERRVPSTGTEEDESSSESAEGSLEQLDLLFEKEQGVVRRAGWLSFKPLVTLHKDRKLELVTRRKWKQYWVTLKGCTLLFYETYSKGSPEQELSPRYALLAEDSIVQAVPEHPKKENVFCLSNSYGDVYLFQASNQTDLENWVTAIHSASASLLAKRQGKEDTVRLLRSQVRALLQKIDMDGKMKKMAELQLTVVSDPKNRKAIENQIQQWEQNLERFNLDLFRMRCYLASLQGGELPNPKSLLAIAGRPTKTTLGRLGIFSVSSFHALICSRDEATVRRRSLSLTHRQRKRGLFSSLKGLDNLTRRGRDKRPSVSQTHADSLSPQSLFPDVCTAAGGGESPYVGLEDGRSHCAHRPVQHSKSVDTVCTLYHSFQEGSGSGGGGVMDDGGEPSVRQGGDLGSSPTGDAALLRPCPKHMTATERLRKVIQELVDTEKSYVKDLTCLFEIYLKPLQDETFLTLDEMESLFGSLPEMLDFQRVFLQTLEERIASSPDFSTLETPSQFKKLLFSLGGSFLYYADHFKLYSGFCANHIKVQKVLERAKTDQTFKEFLDARNPTKQHSSTLESYLIKPVQRVLKYPLLLRELVSLTDGDSEEHYHLTEALKAMEKVASHINEMQKIYEDYGSVFDQLVAEQTGHDKEVTEISMGEFLMHSSVVWLNPHPSLGRMRKDPEMTVFVFKKAVILVCRENNKLKKKMANPRSALSHGDSDPFKFRWLIPLSALQVRLGNTAGTGTQSSCIWELIHSRSEVEGRPETVFQLCSSVPESKVSIIKVIRSILRENVRRNVKGEGTLERSCKEHLAPLRSTLPSSARLGSSRASWLFKQPPAELSTQGETPKLGPDSDEGSLSSGTYSLSGAPPARVSSDSPISPVQQNWSQTHGSNSQPRSTSVKESDILSDEDDDGFSEGGTRRDSGDSGSPTSAIEAQFLQLKLSEDSASEGAPAPRVQPEGVGDTPEMQPKLVRGHFTAVKRKPCSFRRSPGALLKMKEQSRSLDGQTDAALPCGAVDLNTLLEREFSVQSLTSVVNEDCFYDPAESGATGASSQVSA
ncbi:T-lymphoma invasion and metastasis-inducing protein 2 [Neolamprologus brichardi]|nr:T-lymphoma invasion and metastasis-inducing protein 2 [Neolamprologus brichardi]